MKRIATILALLALLSPWAPHRHANAATDGHEAHAAAHATNDARPLTIFSDDAHHEHSSTPEVEAADCPVCRSTAEREGDFDSRSVVLVPRGNDSRATTVVEPRIPAADTIGLHPTRAPPAG